MGLIVASNIIISSERRGESPSTLLSRIREVAGDQEVALSAIGFTELVHGVYRTDSRARRSDRRALLDDYCSQLNVYPYTQAVAELAGRIDGEQTALRCLVPEIDGAYFSERQKEALWVKFFTGAPARLRQSVERYNIVKRA